MTNALRSESTHNHERSEGRKRQEGRTTSTFSGLAASHAVKRVQRACSAAIPSASGVHVVKSQIAGFTNLAVGTKYHSLG